jgi:hypothetical protein
VPLASRCWACTAIGERVETYRKDGQEPPHFHALRFASTRVDFPD